MLCFAVDNRNSFENVQKKWKIELANSMPKTPILLVATKMDLKNSPGAVTEQEMEEMMTRVSAQGLVKTSAKEFTDKNVNAAFQTAIQSAVLSKYDL